MALSFQLPEEDELVRLLVVRFRVVFRLVVVFFRLVPDFFFAVDVDFLAVAVVFAFDVDFFWAAAQA